MMTRRTAILLGLAGSIAPAASKEFWNEKKPSEWTADAIDLLLTKSPWAKEAAVSYYGGQEGPLSNSLPGTSSRRSGNASSKSAPSVQSPLAWQAVVRWESSKPLREALKLTEWPDADKYYVLNMVGDVPSGFETLKQYTKLEHKGDEIQLAKVAASPKNNLTPGGILFFFSRGLALRKEDKQAVFSTKLGPIDVKCRFTLKDMMYQGNLEL